MREASAAKLQIFYKAQKNGHREHRGSPRAQRKIKKNLSELCVTLWSLCHNYF